MKPNQTQIQTVTPTPKLYRKFYALCMLFTSQNHFKYHELVQYWDLQLTMHCKMIYQFLIFVIS
jgi:hypothetical protein